MALTNPSLIPVRVNGQVIDQTWFNIIRTQLINFFNEITALQTGANRKFNITGHLPSVGVTTGTAIGLAEFVVEQPFKLTAVALIGGQLFNSTGFAEIDVKKKRGGGAFTTVFITKPKIDMGQGDYERSDSGGGASVDSQIDTVEELFVKGDIVRLDGTLMPSIPAVTDGMRQMFINLSVTPGS